MSVIRAFIAVDLSVEVRRQLQQINLQLRSLPGAEAVRWVAPENIHLTLLFLGDISPANLPVLQQALLADAAQYPCQTFTVGGLGAFPSLARPRVVWIGVQPPPGLLSLQAAVQHSLDRLGYTTEERSFSPHLTLGRIGRTATPQQVRLLGEAMQKIQVGSLGVSLLQQIHLYRSDLRPSGPVYTVLCSASLADKIASGS